MQLCIFEDKEYFRFEPINLSRPVFDLICGITTLREKIIRAYAGNKYSLLCRNYLADVVKELNPGVEVNSQISGSCLFINGRIIAPSDMAEVIPLNGEDKIYKSGNLIAAARLSGKNLLELNKKNPDITDVLASLSLPEEKIEIKHVDYFWELIKHNSAEIRNDFNFLLNLNGKENNIRGRVSDGAHLVEKDNIYISEGAVVKPGAVIDGSDGPIYIGENALVGANAVIEGAVYVGANSVVKINAAIYQNASIGFTCKVGGEVEDSIISPFTNKQHPGFLGHSYLGSWINIGADTNCSDLKNNYSTVKVRNNGEVTDTGMQFLGLVMGDHSKTAINTMFNTGTVVGFSCSIFGAGFPEKFIPSFSWGGSDGMIEYEVDKGIETARRAMLRRKKEMSIGEMKMFKEIFDITKTEREKR